MRTALAPLLLVLAPAVACASAFAKLPAPPVPVAGPRVEFDHSHAVLDELLKRHVRGDRVDYVELAKERDQLEGYLATLVAVTPAELESWTREEQYAFWINVYNGFCLQLVLENYPVGSIQDIGGVLLNKVWDKEFIPLSAHHPKGDDDMLSLDDVEHGILRPTYQDARVHAAVNCASISCPPLLAGAFVAERLDEQLDSQMRAFLADTTRNRYDAKKKVLRLSKIFEWFSGDFERDGKSVREYVIRYSGTALAAPATLRDARIAYLDYDWKLNDVER